MSPDPVPFLDLATLHRELEPELREAVLPLLRNAAFIGGDPVRRFETAFSETLGGPSVVSVKSGTAALRLGLEALGVTAGDEVVVPAFTFIATATAVLHLGARPVFADVTADTAGLDAEAAAAAVTDRTRVLLPVHLYGHPAPMAPLTDLAAAKGLEILEDCAQSHLATLDGRMTGTLGRLGAFSFYPTKNLGAAGDAGCLTAAEPALAERLRAMADHGRTDRFTHGIVGWNERLDALQAAVLAVKVTRLAAWTEERRTAAARYRELLAGAAPWGEPLRLPVERPGARAVYHLYVTRHSRRDTIAAVLQEGGIGTASHYPLTLPQQPAFRERGLGAGSFPAAEAWARECLALPLYPGLRPAQQERVAEAIHALPS